MYLFISGAELILILFVAVMIFGTDKVPEIARGLGKTMRQIKDATNDIKHEVQKSAEKNGIDTNVASDITKQIEEVKEDLDNLTGPIKRSL
jgi:sec-independent protein translocase protein TatA